MRQLVLNKSIFRKKIKMALVAGLIILSSAVAPLGVFGSPKASAADPLGDWYTQYQITANASVNYCHDHAYQDARGACIRLGAEYNGPYGANSRWFAWYMHWSAMTCVKTYYISNNYIVFGSSISCWREYNA